MNHKRNWKSEEKLKKRLKAIGIVIANLRKQKGFSRIEFAKIVDISPSYLSRIERSSGKPPCVPSTGLLFDIAQALGIDLRDLLVAAERIVDKDMAE